VPDDCHILIRWSELQNLVIVHMACAKCGKAITKFDHWTIRIAMELDFWCTSCKIYRRHMEK
jgi:hypothetical protein